MNLRNIILIILFFSFCSQPEILNEKIIGSPKPTYALVVGVTNYLNLDPLVNPKNDADAMADVLQGFGFTVIKLIDPSKLDFEFTIKEFQNNIMNKKGAILFYYSGHGIQRNGTNYLLPIDADLDDVEDNQWIDFNSILRVIEKSKNPVNILILDTCRDNPQYSTSSNRKRGLIPISKVKSLPAPKSTIISYATSPGMTADDGESKNGVYTEALLNLLYDSDYLSENHIYKIFTRTIEQVQGKTQDKQLPQISSNLTKDYFLSKRSGGRIIPYVYDPRTICQNMGRTWSYSENRCLEPPPPPKPNLDPPKPDPIVYCQNMGNVWNYAENRCEPPPTPSPKPNPDPPKPDPRVNCQNMGKVWDYVENRCTEPDPPKPEPKPPGPFNLNGLTWSVHKGSFNWNKAIEVCKKDNMRLPTKSELKNLFDSGDYRRFYPDSWHWSSDELSSDGGMIKIGKIPQKAYDVFLQKGEHGKSLKAEIRNVRCVK
jgi:hypothetical protein